MEILRAGIFLIAATGMTTAGLKSSFHFLVYVVVSLISSEAKYAQYGSHV